MANALKVVFTGYVVLYFFFLIPHVSWFFVEISSESKERNRKKNIYMKKSMKKNGFLVSMNRSQFITYWHKHTISMWCNIRESFLLLLLLRRMYFVVWCAVRQPQQKLWFVSVSWDINNSGKHSNEHLCVHYFLKILTKNGLGFIGCYSIFFF